MKTAHEHRCLYRGSVSCGGDKPGKPKTKKCPACGSAWLVLEGVYGVFKWTSENRYPLTDAIKTYASHTLAEKFAERMNFNVDYRPVGGYVVRFISR